MAQKGRKFCKFSKENILENIKIENKNRNLEKFLKISKTRMFADF